MNNLKTFFYGFFHKFSALCLALGLYQALKFSGAIEGLKGEFYYVPALILMIVMILVFGKYLGTMNSKNFQILVLSFLTGVALIYFL